MATVSAKRKYLSVEEKVRVIREIESGKRKSDVCREFDLVYKTVLSFWKNRDKIIEKFERLKSKPELDEKIAESNNIDEELFHWVTAQKGENDDVSDTLIKARAEEFATVLGYEDFECTDEWLEGFKCRHCEYFPEVDLEDNEDCVSTVSNVSNVNTNEENSSNGDCFLPGPESEEPETPSVNESEENFDAKFFEPNFELPKEDFLNAEPLKCLQCNLNFTDKEEHHDHIIKHVTLPAVTLTRVKVALAPIRIILKSKENNNFEIISSPQLSPKIEELEEPAHEAEDSMECAAEEAHDNGIPTIEEIVENESELDDLVAGVGEADSDIDAHADADTNVSFSPNYINTDIDDLEDLPDIAGSQDNQSPSPEKPTDYQNVPGAEPTPPPEPSPEYPKIRIKTGLLKESLTITEITDDNPNGEFTNQTTTEYANLDNYNNWATPSLEDPLRLPDVTENDSSILSNLFSNNNDRAKDLGFTTSDTEFLSMEPRTASNALQVYSSSANSNSMVASNPLDTLTNLPMQQLAQQVSRLQPNGNNGMHQQNVLINIQQFPQAPPQQHSYQPQPHMYPHPQPMYHQAYQYQPPSPMYYPQAPGYHPPHMPPPPRPQMPPQMAPPSQQTSQHSQQQPMPNGQPPPYRQPPPPRQPIYSPRQQNKPGQRGGMQPRVSMQQMGPRQFNPRQPVGPRQRAPMMQGRGGMLGARGPRPRMPMQNGQAPQQPNGPRMIKRSPEAIQAMQAKRKKMDVLVPDKHDDADCQVIAVQPKNTGLPQIQSIQGNAPEPADNSVMHLSDSITLSVRNPPPKPPSPKKSDAKDVANILATRGITVTATPKGKEIINKPTSQSPEPPVAINLNSAVCIIPTAKNQPQAKTNDKLHTVDLTDDTVEAAAPSPPKQMPQKQHQQQNKVLPFQCDLCPAKYPNSLSLNKHRQSFHKTGSMCDYGIPLIDLKTPGVVQRLTTLGIHSYIPLPGANSDTTFALPIINTNTYKNANLNSIGATSVLTLGPVRMFPRPPQSK